MDRQLKNNINFIKLVQENPHLPITPMVDTDILTEDYGWVKADFGISFVDSYWCDDERMYLLSDDRDDLIGKVIDERFDNEWEGKTDKEMEEMAENIVNNYNWTKSIIVYISD